MAFWKISRGNVLRFLCFCLVIGTLSPSGWLVESPGVSARSAAAQVSACTTSQIKISEVEADPVGSEPGAEWFELFNTGSECEMSGWTITDNGSSDNLFSGMGGSNVVRIATGGHIIFAGESADFLTDHPGFSGALVDVPSTAIGNGLANAADFLRLRDGSSNDVDCVAWGSPAGNPCGFMVTAAAGDTRTLQRTPTDGTDTDSATDWTNANTETLSGTPTAVLLASFTVHSVKDRVLIQWETVSELDIVGFNILRSTVRDGSYSRINDTMIPAQMSGGLLGAKYGYADRNVTPGAIYHYILEVVNAGGSVETFGPVAVRVRGSRVEIQ
jgi:hypothetical protein